MSRGYRCVGGPLDGQFKVCLDGVTQFNFAKLAAGMDWLPHAVAEDPPAANPIAYTLKRQHNGTWAWVCQ